MFFYRTWAEYKSGFGSTDGHYWLGNEMLHQLSQNDGYKLRFDLQKTNGGMFWAQYSNFSVGSESAMYTLNVTGSAFSGVHFVQRNGAVQRDEVFDVR